MKPLIIFSLFLLNAVFSTTLQAATLTVIIDHIHIKKGGQIRIGLYSPKEKFLSPQSYQGKVQRVTAKKLTFVFTNLPAGRYAVSSFQDINSNKKLDKNFIGLPKEPYGISGRSQWGKPKFKPASFKLGNKNTTITIRLN